MRSESGQTLAEFAIVAPIMILLLLGMVDIGVTTLKLQQSQALAWEAAWSHDETAANAILGGLPSNTTATVADDNDTTTVTVRYQAAMIFGLLPTPWDITLTATSHKQPWQATPTP